MDDRTNHLPTGCRCGHTFCYACGLQWKTCSCPQFPAAPRRARPESRVPVYSPETLGLRANQSDNPGWGVQPLANNLGSDLNLGPRLRSWGVAEELPGRSSPASSGHRLRPWGVAEGLPGRSSPASSGHRLRSWGVAEELPERSSPASSGCDVHDWDRIGGGMSCQSCGNFMPSFLFRCRACRHASCLRCRYLGN